MSMVIVLPAGAVSVKHDLRISLDPSGSRLDGLDVMDIQPEGAAELSFALTGSASDIRVTLNDRPAPFDVRRSGLRLALKTAERKGLIRVTIKYAAVFDDPIPLMPVNTDNPGFGVTGTINEKGTFLLSGAGWYPHIEADSAAYRIRVRAPAGVIAVTAGRSLGHETKDGFTISNWQIDHPVRGVSLSAARYQVEERTVGKVTAATYFYSESRHLSARYLDAIGRYLQLYADLFGPYPFAKFAVVENFFPTGYGFPSYTLLGSRVLALPFIVRTSLGHEIAHCWWGNGVYVDYAKGNWSEGLTTYVADYLYKEMISADKARKYRRQILRNYATLVGPGSDFPLSRFQSRHNPASRAIGYDKSAMVFHMLRQQLGDEAFWGALRDVFQNRLFKVVSWNDFRIAFERSGNVHLKKYFGQWVERSGAPQLAFDDIVSERNGRGWIVKGRIVQQRPYFNLPAELLLLADGKAISEEINISGRETRFEMHCDGQPEKLTLDPDVDVFRRLESNEIPPAVNSIKGASSVLVVMSDDLKAEVKEAAETLLRSLGLNTFRLIPEGRVDHAALTENDLLFVGLPQRAELAAGLSGQIPLNRKSFVLNGSEFNDPADTFFGVFEHPWAKKGTAALFLPLSSQYAKIVARKITHYGKYSYLAFHGGQNRAKGTWPVLKSPLIYRWPK